MTKNDKRHEFIDRVRRDNQLCLDDLRGENERVRSLAVGLQTENEHLRAIVENQQEDIRRYQAECGIYRDQLARIEAAGRRDGQQFVDLEQRNLALANLYVASYQLHGTLSREAVLQAINEIIINLIGSERFGVYELNRLADTFDLVASHGLATDLFQHVSATTSVIGRCAMSGEMLVNPSRDEAEVAGLVACIPLKLDQSVTGAIAIFQLLAHKSQLEDLDFALFDLLATHAATALYCTSLHSRAMTSTHEGDGANDAMRA